MKKRIVVTGRRATLEDVIRVLKVPKKEVKETLELLKNPRLARCSVCGKSIMKCICADGYV